MASSTANPQAANLASLLLVKRKLDAKNSDQSNAQLPPPAPAGASSGENMAYHQDMLTGNPQETTTTGIPANTTEKPKVSRKTKQLEVELLDKKMDEIHRKQETKTNETLGTWKGFDSLNYGFNSVPGTQRSTPVPSESTQQKKSSSSPLPNKQPSPSKTPEKNVTEPPRQESAVQQQSASKHLSPARKETPLPPQKTLQKEPSPLPSQKNPQKEPSPSPKQENVDKQPSPSPLPRQKLIENQPTPSPRQKLIANQPTPSPRQKSIENQPNPPSQEKPIEKGPSPHPLSARRSKANSTSPFEQGKSPEQEQSKSAPTTSPAHITEDIVPISTAISNPQIFEQNGQPFKQSSAPISPSHQSKLFPNIKHSEIRKFRNAHKSIQRSMDRYRFHAW